GARSLAALAISAVALAGMSLTSSAGAAGPSLAPSVALPAAQQGKAVARPYIKVLSRTHFGTAPTTADCLGSFGIACYVPAMFQPPYDMPPLYAAGLTGKGRTIVIVASFRSPTAAADL